MCADWGSSKKMSWVRGLDHLYARVSHQLFRLVQAEETQKRRRRSDSLCGQKLASRTRTPANHRSFDDVIDPVDAGEEDGVAVVDPSADVTDVDRSASAFVGNVGSFVSAHPKWNSQAW